MPRGMKCRAAWPPIPTTSRGSRSAAKWRWTPASRPRPLPISAGLMAWTRSRNRTAAPANCFAMPCWPGCTTILPRIARWQAKSSSSWTTPAQRATYFRYMAAGLHHAGDWRQAVEYYLKLVDMEEAKPVLEKVDRSLSCPPRPLGPGPAWLASQRRRRRGRRRDRSCLGKALGRGQEGQGLSTA